MFILGFCKYILELILLTCIILSSCQLTCYSYSLSEFIYHELIVQTVRYVHATTILCSYCSYNNFDSYEIIKHSADKIVTDGYTWIYWQFMYNTIMFLNKHMRLSIIIMVLENNLLHIQFETVLSRKFS